MFDRELEKTVSLSAAIATGTFTHASGERVQFDSRVWLGAERQQVVDYFRWRQNDAARCALNGWCYWQLRKLGASVTEATRRLEGLSIADKNELLFQSGINFNDVPLWQRRGTGLYWEEFEKEGFNPILNQPVVAIRRRVRVDGDLPMGDAYSSWLERFFG